MENQNSENQVEPNFQTPPKQSSLIAIGLKEFLFVIVLLLLIFGTLNFFRIIQLEKFLPQLSFLPHLQNNKSSVSNKQEKLVNNDTFAYNKPIATQLLQTYLEDTLPVSSLSKNTSVEQDFFTDQQTNAISVSNAFSTQWKINNITYNAFFYFRPHTNTPYKSVIFAEKPMIKTVNQNLLFSELFAFFNKSDKQIVQPFSCSILSPNFTCLQVQKGPEKKYSFGTYTIPGNTQTFTLFACILYINGSFSDSEKCLNRP